MSKQPEGKLVTKLQKLIREADGTCFKIHGGDNPFQAVGIPDLLCCIEGRFVGIETKLPGESLSRMQVIALREIFLARGIAAVVETAGQGARLLSYIEKEALRETPNRSADHGVCFDRGRVSYRFTLSSRST